MNYIAKSASTRLIDVVFKNQPCPLSGASACWPLFGVLICLGFCCPGYVYASDVSIRHTVTCDYGPACEIYSATIDDEGHVTFEGAGAVIVKGKHSYRVAPGQISPLLRSLEEVDFWNLPDKFSGPAVDIRGDVITVVKDGNEKSVADFFGEAAGLPKVIHVVEAKVDEIAGIDDWLVPSLGMLLKLDAEKFEYNSVAGAQMAIDATFEKKVSDGFISGLLERGTPVEGGIAPRGRRFFKKFDLIDAAAMTGRTKIAKIILRNHAFGKDEKSQAKLARAFAYGIRSGKAEMVRAFLDYGPPMTFVRPACSASIRMRAQRQSG